MTILSPKQALSHELALATEMARQYAQCRFNDDTAGENTTPATAKAKQDNPLNVDFVKLATQIDEVLECWGVCTEQGIFRSCQLLSSDKLNGVTISQKFAFVGDADYCYQLLFYTAESKRTGTTWNGDDMYYPTYSKFIQKIKPIVQMELDPKRNYSNDEVLENLACQIINTLQDENLI